MGRLNTSRQRKGGQRGQKPSGGELHLAEFPPSSHRRVGGRGGGTHVLCGTVCAPTEHEHEWERAGFLINALHAEKERGGGCVHQASAEATVQSWNWLAEGP